MSDTKHTPLTEHEMATLVEHGRTVNDNTGVDMGPRCVMAGVELIRKAGVEVGRLQAINGVLLAACQGMLESFELAVGEGSPLSGISKDSLRGFFFGEPYNARAAIAQAKAVQL